MQFIEFEENQTEGKAMRTVDVTGASRFPECLLSSLPFLQSDFLRIR